MDLNQRIDVFIKLGQHLATFIKLNNEGINKDEFNELNSTLNLAYI